MHFIVDTLILAMKLTKLHNGEREKHMHKVRITIKENYILHSFWSKDNEEYME